LIALAKVDRLGLLKELYSNIQIPPAVGLELRAKVGPEAARIDSAIEQFVQIASMPPLDREIEGLTGGLGAGEQEAIALAVSIRATLLLIDDRAGREPLNRSVSR
jgi:predicted nucleic acid-binding protein